MLCEPLIGNDPLQDPEAVHDVALVEVHVRFADCPASSVLSDAVSDAVGTGAGATEPPPQAEIVSRAMMRRQSEERTPSRIWFLVV